MQDLVVIGAGSAGLTAARTAAGLGASVTLVERARPGGDCLWTGCVPSKALLAAAAAAHAVRTAGRFGVRAGKPEVDFPAVMAHVRAAQAEIAPEDSAEALRRARIDIVAGSARFTSPSAIEVDGRTLRFRSALVATGSVPVLPPGADPSVLTSESVWDLDARLRTTNPRVFAAGDVTGAPPFTHVAGLHGSLAAANAVVGPLRRVPTDGIGWVTFTDPEVARVGRTIAEAGPGAVVRRIPGSRLDRGVADGRTEGFTLLVGDRRGRLVGATVVSPRAGEVISELAGVIGSGGSVSILVGTVHPYPTYGDGVWAASVADYYARLGRGVSGRAIGLARRARRTWLDRR